MYDEFGNYIGPELSDSDQVRSWTNNVVLRAAGAWLNMAITEARSSTVELSQALLSP